MKRLTYFFFGLLLFSSCEQDANFIVENGHTKLFAYSEISTDNKIKVTVNTAPGLNTDDDYFYPEQQDAQVVLLKDGEILEDPGFRYIAREKAFISQGSFRPEVGVEYGLSVSLKNNTEILPITGKTIIPDPNFIEKYKLDSYNTEQFNPQFKNIEINITVPLKDTDHRFFLMKPYYLDEKGKRADLLVKEVSSGSNGSYYSKANNGLLVDTQKVGSEISMKLVNDKFVPVGYDLVDLYFELVTITEDAHQYYKSYSKQVASQAVSLSEPVISYSNFENGLGLFTGYSSTINTIKL